MTAGSGIVHQEMPQPSERMLGCQLWVNLPAKDKMTLPAYGDITQDDVEIVEEENALIRIISGSYKGRSGAFQGEYIHVKYLDVELAPDATWSYDEAPNNETLFIYLLDGTVAPDKDLSAFENIIFKLATWKFSLLLLLRQTTNRIFAEKRVLFYAPLKTNLLQTTDTHKNGRHLFTYSFLQNKMHLL